VAILLEHREWRGRPVAQSRADRSILDRAAPELGPDSLVFAACLVFRGMRRPVHAHVSEIFETDGDRAAALIEGRAQIRRRQAALARSTVVTARAQTAPSGAAPLSAARRSGNSHSAPFSSSANVNRAGLSHESSAAARRGDEISERRGISGRRLRALARDQVSSASCRARPVR